MFHQLVISHEGLHVAEINKNIQKLKKEYNMSVAEAVKFVKKEFPQFSDICDSFGPHFEYAEAAFKQKNFQKTEPRLSHGTMNKIEPRLSHGMLNKIIIFLLTLLVIFKMRNTYNSSPSFNSSPPRQIVDDFETYSLELITQAGLVSVDKIDKIEKVIEGLKERIQDDLKIELDDHIDNIVEEQDYLKTQPPRPDTTKITKLYLDKEDTEEELKQAKQRLEKLEEKLENLKEIKKSEKQAKADAESGNRQSKEQQMQQATKQQQEKTIETKQKEDIKEAKNRIGIKTK